LGVPVRVPASSGLPPADGRGRIPARPGATRRHVVDPGGYSTLGSRFKWWLTMPP
jgi:hypothetical protein